MAFAALAALTVAAGASDDTMELYKLPGGTVGGQCMDGSPAAYYYRQAQNASSTSWVIYLQGGGACFTKSTCDGRAKSALGSSTSYKQTIAGDESNPIMSSSRTDNPDFYHSNMVYVKYCSSDVHSGNVTKPSPETWNYYFSGHLNFVNIVKHITTTVNPTFAKATSVLLTGGSAGGAGTFVNADWLGSVLPPSTHYRAAPIGGWFFPGDSADHPGDASWTPPSAYPYFAAGKASPPLNNSVYTLWSAYVNPACAAAQKPGEEFHCGTVHVLYPHIKTPMYIMENMYDTNQIGTQLKCPKSSCGRPGTEEGRKFIAYFGNAMRKSILTQLQPKDGVFLPSCLDHTHNLGVHDANNRQGVSAINGTNSGTVLGDWFYGRASKNKTFVLADTCDAANNGLPCNPTCPNILPPGPPGPPGPPPPPSPGPPPPPGPDGKCGAALDFWCPAGLFPTPGKCGTCAKGHTKALHAAGCTVPEVRALCDER